MIRELTPRDVVLIVAVLIFLVVVIWGWWVWPDGRLRITRSRRASTPSSLEDPDDTWWDVPPPYDWLSRPAARTDLGLRSRDFIP
jgi:hypothetical protein